MQPLCCESVVFVSASVLYHKSSSDSACWIASPGCHCAGPLGSSFSSLYAFADLLSIDESTPIFQPYSLRPAEILAAKYRHLALFLDEVQK